MSILLRWADRNYGEDEHRIYRSTSPMDPQNLPAPIATVGQGVTEFYDTTVADATTYYYRVGAFVTGAEYLSEEIEVFSDFDLSIPTGLWIVNMAVRGTADCSHFDVSRTELATWPENFRLTADNILIDNFKYQETGSVDTGTVVGGLIAAGKPGMEFQIYARTSSWHYDRADIDMEFQDSAGNVLAVMRLLQDGSFTHGIWYGPNFSSLTKAPKDSSGDPQTDGFLRFDNDGFEYVVNPDSSFSSLNRSFRYNPPGGMADFAKINVPSMRAYSSYPAGTGASAEGYLRLTGLLGIVGWSITADAKTGDVTLNWDEVAPNATTEVRVYRDTSWLDLENLPAPIATLSGGVGTYSETVAKTANYFYLVQVDFDGKTFSTGQMAAGFVVPTNDLFLEYTMDSITGTALKDTSPTGRNATLSGTYSVVTGVKGNALEFNYVNGSAKIATLPEVAGIPGLSISVWVKLIGTFDADQAIFSKWDGNGATGLGILLWFDHVATLGPAANRTVAFMYNPSAASGGRINGTTDAITPGVWHHIVGVFDGTNNRARLYIDNTLVRENTSGVPSTTTAAQSIPAYLATTAGGQMKSKNIQIDQFRLYARALSESEINALYNE